MNTPTPQTDYSTLISIVGTHLTEHPSIGHYLADNQAFQQWFGPGAHPAHQELPPASPLRLKRSIFEILPPVPSNPHTAEGDNASGAIVPRPMGIDDGLFPGAEPQTLSPDTLKALAERFVERLIMLEPTPNRQTLDRVVALCSRYFSTVADPRQSTLSLYDTLKSRLQTAAAAEEYLLVSGKVSGIQSFIYTITSKGAAKTLQGKSFYVKLLLDALIERILADLDLGRHTLIYNSGGCFFMLIPSDRVTATYLNEVRQQMQEGLRERFGLELSVYVSHTRVRADLENLSQAWQQLYDLHEQQKFAPLSDLMATQYDTLFAPHFRSSDPSIDFARLGSQLRRSNCLVVTDHRCDDSSEVFQLNPGEVGIWFRLADYEQIQQDQTLSESCLRMVLLNPDTDSYAPLFEAEYYGGNRNPANNGQMLSFEELVEPSGELSRLGILRMDVDHLGSTFARVHTLSSVSDTLATLGALSSSLDWFFKGYINTLHRAFPRTLSIVYSGGDDLFVVGRWCDVVTFGEQLHEAFARYTRGRLTLSAGVAVVPVKYPIAQGADESGRQEACAKGFCHGTQQKNALSLFDFPMRWGEEFRWVRRLSRQLQELIGRGVVDKALITKIGRYHFNARFASGHITTYPTLWRMSYDLTRMIGRYKHIPEARSFLQSCLNDLVCNTVEGIQRDTPYHSLQLWGMAARLAELQLRTERPASHQTK